MCPRRKKWVACFFFQPLILLTKSYPTTYWAKLCFVLLNAKPSNLPAFVPTIGSFFFLAFCKCKQQTERTGMWMSAPKRHETSPSYFFSRCLFKRRLFLRSKRGLSWWPQAGLCLRGKLMFFFAGAKKKTWFPPTLTSREKRSIFEKKDARAKKKVRAHSIYAGWFFVSLHLTANGK